MASRLVATFLTFLFYFSFFAVVSSTPSNPGVGHVVEERNDSIIVLDLQQDFPDLRNSRDFFFQFEVTIPVEVTQFFFIASLNGQISTWGAIDRESLNFSASDAFEFQVGSYPGPKFKRVRIFVDDINDNAPEFPAVDSENATIVENAALGNVISSPSAYDPDIGNNTVQTYSGIITSGNEGGHFSLRQTKLDTHRLKMEFTLAKSLDRETQQYYQFNVTVTDGGDPRLSAWILFNLTVLDVNDNAPSFDQTNLKLNVPEDTLTGTVLVQVQATDLDENPLLTYSINSITPAQYNGRKTMDMFSIDAVTGKMKLLEPLDYEFTQYRRIDLAVTVSDGSRTDSAVVNLFVIDANDNPPHIVSVLGSPMSLGEDFSPGVPFMFVFANDPDSNMNSELGFNLTGGKGYFNLTYYLLFGSLYRASVQLTRSLDREDIDKFDLTITVFDHGVPQLTANWSDILTVSDVNDNSPTFVTGPYSKTLAEDIRVDSVVLTVSAEDPDAGANGTVEYLIPSDQPLFQWFAVDSAGVVKTAQKLDRETAGIVNLTVTARDKGRPPRSTNTTVTVTLADVNDNDPTFSQLQYNIEVPENESVGVVVATLIANDPDEGVFGDVTYSISSETSVNVFFLNSQSGELSLNATLDRESIAHHILVVDAHDGGGRTSSAYVVVNVTDINEHHPEFYPSHYDCVIYENTTVGHHCVIVKATDKDENKVTYEIVSGNDESDFRLDRHSGYLVTANTLDHEQQQSYVLVVSATDSGGLKSNPDATVNVTVANVLDKPPLFGNMSYAFRVNETDNPGMTVGWVSAVKQDAAKNGKLMYVITGGDVLGRFEVDSLSGRISLKKSIDREKVAFYQLNVEAHCCGPAPLIAMATVNVTVTDANDNAPTFSVSDGETLKVYENKPVGFVIASLSAADNDEGVNGDVYYHLAAERDGFFVIDQATGNLSLNQSLDYETVNKTSISVTAYDRGSPQQSTSISLVISVIDVNDNRPVFAPTAYRVSVLENVSLAHTVLRVSSSDLDSGSNGEISYSLDAGAGLPFTIIATGDIYTVRELDAETKRSYDFNVTARDNGQPSLNATAPVHIDVLDVNDNSPVFDPTVNLTFNVIENVQFGHVIGQVVATDSDEGQNGEVAYSFQTPSTTFQVDPSNGTIVTAGSVDRETKSSYTLTVAASDHGAVRRTTTTVIQIHVLDVNDNPPVFDDKLDSNFSVWETASVNETFDVVVAHDADAGLNGQLSYTIKSGNENGDLYIDSKLGSLVVAKSLDHETVSWYNLTIEATDGGSPPRTSLKQIQVRVKDVNDNAPVFVNSSGVTVRIREDMPTHSSLAQLLATDRDSGENGVVLFSITSGNINSAFQMDSQSGILRNSRSLDYETRKTYNLTITAKDNAAANRLETSIWVGVSLIDVNDNAPTFRPSSFGKAVYEDIPVFASVYRVTATDGDHGTNGEIRYSIFKQAPPPANGQSMLFTIEQMSGIVRTQRPLTATVSTYDLTIMAEDQAAVPADRLNATATLKVSIQKRTNCPRVSFMKKGPLTVAEDAPIDVALLVVAASVKSHPSCPPASLQFEYALDHGNDGNTFQLDHLKGELKLLKTLDRETRGQYNLSIHAYGTGAPPPIVARLLQVVVSDVNDNSPVFSSVGYAAAVDEGTAEGLTVVKVHADDDDLGSNGDVMYAITAGNQYGFFAVSNSTGWIRVASVLTPPQGQTVFRLTVRAEDQGIPSRWSTVEVAVSVRARCIPPVFRQPSYVFPVGENNPDNAVVGVIQAMDSASRQLNYQLVGTQLSNLFVVDANNGEITVTRGLDYEVEREFSFMVQASLVSACNSSLQANVPVKVEVVDANDNNPMFEKSTYDGRVNETALVGHPVLRVKANDDDSGPFGTMVYTLEGDDGKFTVNASTGWISVAAPLDREQTSSYIFLVRASESVSQGSQSTYAPVRVVIDDANDNAPVFTQSSYEVNVSSQVLPGIQVVQVVALDADAGSNGEVSYSFATPQAAFVLDQQTGLVTTSVKGLLAGTLYQFTVVATDKGSPSVASRQQVEVRTVDPSMHELPPRFLQSTIRRVLDENTGAGYQLATVNAVSDRAGVKNIQYSLFKGNSDGKFSIGSTGSLTLANSLDADVVDFYDLVVRADDQHKDGSLHSDMHVYVNVTPVSGDIAEFIRPRIGHVMENQPVNTSVMTVTACNPFVISCNADDLQYYLATDGDSRAFVIDYQTGELRTAVLFDAEHKQSYDIVVSAVDLSQGSQSGTATIQISVFDQNDNEPHFFPLSNLSVPENTSVGTLITTLSASDNDVNHQLRYSLIKGADNKFLVHSSDGRVTVEFPLDYETTDLYEVSVAVYDGKFIDEAKFYVTVLDSNDNPPQFSSSIYQSSILERSQPGKFVANVSATDRDSGVNGEVFFALRDTGNNLFRIDTSTGVITCNRTVTYRYHSTNIYDLTVTAFDRGTPRLSAEATVSVSIVDLNDYAPNFIGSPFSIHVPENAPQGATVGSVMATDDDKEGPNGEVNYQVEDGNGTQWFTIQLTTGAVVVVRQGFVQGESYSFRVKAFDLGVRPQRLESSAIVYLDIVSKQPVVFNQTKYYVTLPENSQPGTLVVTVKASAGSQQFSIPLQYQITAGRGSGKFVIDGSEGRIETKTTLDFSTASDYELTVTATDKTSSGSSASATVYVTVTDVNDNAPIFRLSIYRAEVFENSIDSTIVTVSATDDDSGVNSKIVFSLVPGGDSMMFKINSTTGTISAKQPLDYERKDHYSFAVKAVDMGNPPMSSTATVNVTVKSENEDAPVFESSSYEFSVGTTVKPGASIGRVAAQDGDQGSDGRISYSFGNVDVADRAGVSMQENGVVVFNGHTTDRVRRSSRSRVRRDTDYELTAIARDHGKPPKSATAAVVLRVATTGQTGTTSGGSSSSSQTIIIVAAVVVVVLLVLFALLFLVLWKKKRTGSVDFPNNRKPITLYVASNPATHSQERQRQQEQQQQEMAVYNERPVDVIGAAKDILQSNTSLTSASGRFRSQDKLLSRSPQDSSNSSVVENSPDDMSPGEDKRVVLPSASESSAVSMLPKKAYSPSQSRTGSEMRTNSDAGSVRSGTRQDLDPSLMQNIWRDLENMGLMKDGQESTHDFNIQGGGEADGGIDVSNLLNTRLAEADADEFDAIIDGTRAFSYEGASDTVTVSAGGSVASTGYAEDDFVSNPYGQDYRRPWLSEISRTRSPKQPPPVPAPVRPGMAGFPSQQGRPMQPRHALPNQHGRRPGAPPIAGKNRLGRGMKNNGLSPCISPGVSMSTSLATTPAATPSAGNLSPIVSPTLSPSERTESRGSTPSMTPTHSSVSEVDTVDR